MKSLLHITEDLNSGPKNHVKVRHSGTNVCNPSMILTGESWDSSRLASLVHAVVNYKRALVINKMDTEN